MQDETNATPAPSEAQVADITGCRKEESSTEVECGEIVKTKWFSPEGKMVREDVNVKISEEYLAKALAGLTKL